MIEIISLVLAIGAMGIAVFQVRQAREVSKLHSEIVAIQAHLVIELAGRRDPDRLKQLLEILFSLVEKLGDIDPRIDSIREVRYERER